MIGRCRYNKINIISTNKAPKAIGAYSQAVEINDFIFTSGQIPINPKTGKIESENFSNQVQQVLRNIENILISKKLNLTNILKLTVYLTDLNNFDELNNVFSRYFINNFPARSVVQVSKLPKNSKIEIDAICYK